MAKSIVLAKISNQKITVGPGEPVVIVPEVGVLTFGEKKAGFKFVDEAVRIGAKLLKFQCFNPENVVSLQDKFWLKRLRQRALSQTDFLKIMEYGRQKDIICFASAHNEYDLVTLAKAGMPILKIGSGDSNNFRMIDMALRTGKPVILSLGLLRKKEVFDVLKRYRRDADQLIILHCTTVYPAEPRLANLDLIRQMARAYPQFNFGYSDHVAGYNVALAAAAMPEVRIIEKHFCLPNHKVKPKFESMDIPPALTPDDFKCLLAGVKEIFQAMGAPKEEKAVFVNKKWAHKAICAHRDILAGKVVESDDLMSIRPYDSKKRHVPISDFYKLVGKKVRKAKKKGEYLFLDDF